LLQNIDVKYRSQVVSLLKWLASSKEVLTLEEFAEVFVLRPEHDVPLNKSDRLFAPKNVLRYVSSLVVTQDGNRGYSPANVRLAHFTIKEYLTSARIAEGPAATFAFTEPNAHLHIAHCCLAYHHHLVSISDANDEDFPLREYAIYNWMLHLELVQRELWPDKLAQLAARALATRSESLRIILGRNGIFYPKKLDFGEPWYSRMLLRPLCYTARRGFLGLTKLLLSEHPDTNRYVTPKDLDTALQEAAFGGHAEIVQVLLDRGADVRAEGGTFGGALQAAAYRGHTAVVDLLLDRGADVNAQHGKVGSALQAAASKQHLDTVQLL
ncbi:ankyrin, partial [Cryphonectria parasitica EP155]